jgi:enoyl-CoA hydratase
MELILTGRNFTAQEASDWGLVSRVVEEGEGKVVEEAVKVADQIASKSRVASQACKEAVNAGSSQTILP